MHLGVKVHGLLFSGHCGIDLWPLGSVLEESCSEQISNIFVGREESKNRFVDASRGHRVS